jgi:hypothetical protein
MAAEDFDRSENSPNFFPRGCTDCHNEQVDLRQKNSWKLRLHEIGTVEFLEVQTVNVTAPFVLVSGLRSLMARNEEVCLPSFPPSLLSSFPPSLLPPSILPFPSFVSSMEGRF